MALTEISVQFMSGISCEAHWGGSRGSVLAAFRRNSSSPGFSSESCCICGKRELVQGYLAHKKRPSPRGPP